MTAPELDPETAFARPGVSRDVRVLLERATNCG